jgi:hypothetical protein
MNKAETRAERIDPALAAVQQSMRLSAATQVHVPTSRKTAQTLRNI